MKGNAALIWAMILAMIALPKCGTAPSSGDQRVGFVDDLGNQVMVPAHPERVVSLAPNLTEIVFAAGGGDQLAAVTTADDFPREVEQMPKVTAFPLNHEDIVAQSPDLILATDQVNSPHDVKPFADLDIPTVFFRFVTVDDIISGVRKVGELLGTEETATIAANRLQKRWARLDSASSSVDYRPRLLLLVGFDVLYAFGGESYTTEMIRAAGAESVTAELPGQSAVLSDEFVLGGAPEIIIGTGDKFGLDALLRHHPTWDALPAVRNGFVRGVEADLVLRPGPRVIDGTEAFATIVNAFRETSNQ